MSSGALPRATPDLAGVGGTLKAEPADFVVEELPLYEPLGEGEHVYVRLRREGWTTFELARRLGALFDLPSRAVGVAGRKDKHARVTQTFSLHMHKGEPGELATRIADELPVEVLDARRHANKLKRGHLLGNRFTVRITDVAELDTAQARSQAVCAALEQRGLPNYYGPQRFGMDGGNVERAERLLERLARGRGRKRHSDRDRLMLSAWQAELFNRWLALRIRRGDFQELAPGDLAHKEGTGGLFLVEDIERERPRFLRREITYTGPMFGARMRRPSGRPDELEREVLAAALDAAPFDEGTLGLAGLDGTRRVGRIAPRNLSIAAVAGGLAVTFELPKGSYATTLLEELMKVETTAVPAPAPERAPDNTQTGA